MSSTVSLSQNVAWLLRDKYHLTPGELMSARQAEWLDHQPWRAEFHQDLLRLRRGEPLAYVIGWVSFLGARIELGERPLIPRPETEAWVAGMLDAMPNDEVSRQVLDLCCGSGCIGIAVLRAHPLATVTFIDNDPRALRQTAHNLTLNHIPTDRYRLVASDLWERVAGQRFHTIVANPPYVDRAGNYSPLLAWEPEQALFAQDNGLKLINQILLNAQNFLFPGGELWLEFGDHQADRIQTVVANMAAANVKIIADQFGRDRVARVTFGEAPPRK